MIKCLLCGLEFKGLSLHLFYKHNVRCKEYLQRFPDSLIQSPEILTKARANSPILKTGHPNYNIEKKGCWQKGHKNWNAELNKKDSVKLAEMSQKASETKKRRFVLGELIPWNKGLTKESDERILKYAQKVSIKKCGIPLSEKHRLSLIVANRKIAFNQKISKSGIRQNLNNQYFRSTWEANLARILNYLGIKWEYESRRIFLNDCSYLPDFYLPDFKIYIEVKGDRFGKDKKLQLLHQQIPNFPLKVLDREGYQILQRKYSCIINGWEK